MARNILPVLVAPVTVTFISPTGPTLAESASDTGTFTDELVDVSFDIPAAWEVESKVLIAQQESSGTGSTQTKFHHIGYDVVKDNGALQIEVALQQEPFEAGQSLEEWLRNHDAQAPLFSDYVEYDQRSLVKRSDGTEVLYAEGKVHDDDGDSYVFRFVVIPHEETVWTVNLIRGNDINAFRVIADSVSIGDGAPESVALLATAVPQMEQVQPQQRFIQPEALGVYTNAYVPLAKTPYSNRWLVETWPGHDDYYWDCYAVDVSRTHGGNNVTESNFDKAYAAFSGTVQYDGEYLPTAPIYGHIVIIQSTSTLSQLDGDYLFALYAHFENPSPYVNPGSTVVANASSRSIINTIGSDGSSEAAHLHFALVAASSLSAVRQRNVEPLPLYDDYFGTTQYFTYGIDVNTDFQITQASLQQYHPDTYTGGKKGTCDINPPSFAPPDCSDDEDQFMCGVTFAHMYLQPTCGTPPCPESVDSAYRGR